MKPSFTTLKTLLLALLLAVGVSYASAAWIANTESPPTCTDLTIPGCNPPINVSATAQAKKGALSVGSSLGTLPTTALDVFGKMKVGGDAVFLGGVQIVNSAEEGKVLTSDAAGNATWQDASGGGVTDTTLNLALMGYRERVVNADGVDFYGGFGGAHYRASDTCGNGKTKEFTCAPTDDAKFCTDIAEVEETRYAYGDPYTVSVSKSRSVACYKETYLVKVAGDTTKTQSCSGWRSCATPTIDICAVYPTLAIGQTFTVNSDVTGSNWVQSPNTLLRTVTFTKGTAKTDTIASSGNKRNNNSRAYNGGCYVSGKSWYSGDSTDSAATKIKISVP